VKTSALTGMNVNDAFDNLRKGIREWVDREEI